jgi:TRAP-type mannitol/chloroaromatic compound transport system substrate-binding protein
MRSIIVGIVIGSVIGVMVGTTIIAPRLSPDQSEPVKSQNETDEKQVTAPPPEKSQSATELPPAGPEKPTVRWRMASAYSGNLPQLGTLAKRVGRTIWEVSDGGIEIKFFEPGTLVPSSNMFDAVASGAIDTAFSSPGFWGEKEPALQLFSAVPFGPPPGEYLAWVYFSGGEGLLNEIYHPHGIHSILCGMIAPEASGWYRRAFTTPEDLKGLKMRTSGLGAKVLNKLGIQTLSLNDVDIFLALENGDIDAAEFSMPAIDLKLGFQELASHYYFPGWQQPSSFFELLINKDKWDGLPKTKKSQIETVCGDNVRHGLAEGEALQYEALKELTAKGVKIQRWPDSILNAMEKAWNEVAAEQASADSKFRRVWRSLSDFRKDYAIWDELARP